MSYPIVTIEPQGNILSRPRREPLYDTEAAVAGSAWPSPMRLFSDSTRFTASTPTLTKQKYRDTNLDAPTGLAAGQHFYWYQLRVQIKTLDRNLNTTPEASADWFDIARQVREVCWGTFNFQQNKPYFTDQLWQFPSGIDETPFSTALNTTIIGPACIQERREGYDVTLGNGGDPVEFEELETWTFVVEGSGGGITLPTVPANHDTYCKALMIGTFLRGVQ